MKFHEFIGIDVSKDTLDVYNLSSVSYNRYPNSVKGFNSLQRWLKKSLGTLDEVLICMEYTGMYSNGIMEQLDKEGLNFVMVSGLEVKRSLGIQRGKNDKVDARRLAEYIYLRRDQVELYRLPSKNLVNLKTLLSFRSRMVRQRAGYTASLKEYKKFMAVEDIQCLITCHEELITKFSLKIKDIDKELRQIIRADEVIGQQYKLATSVKGVGILVALTMIAYTNCFTSFKNWRKFASYAGTAPFENTSGTSIRGKTKVSHLANKRVKSLLHLAAMSAIRHNMELKSYYERRIADGKNKMSTLNIIRNKLISRIFATVTRQTPYVDVFKFAA
jgi:transposase